MHLRNFILANLTVLVRGVRLRRLVDQSLGLIIIILVNVMRLRKLLLDENLRLVFINVVVWICQQPVRLKVGDVISY